MDSVEQTSTPVRQPGSVAGERAGSATPGAVRTIRVADWETLPSLESDWNELLTRAADASVFQTFQWQICWWRAFGGPHKLLLILAYVGARLAGVAPMMIVRGRGPIGRGQRRVHFIGSTNHASDYCDFIADPDVPGALEALLEEMCTAAEAVDRIDLSHFPEHSPNRARVLEYFKGRGLALVSEVQAEAPVRILGDREADLRAANKSSLRRHAGFFRRSGKLCFRECTSEAEVAEYLDRFFAQHSARWSQRGSPSQFLDPAQRFFYRQLVRELLPYGWLRFHVVLFDDAPLAFHFGFEFRRSFIWYKPTFDVRFASKSPGEVLIKLLLEDAIEKNLAEFDFTVGSESFKYRFANCVRRISRLMVFHSRLDFWMCRAARVLKDALGRNPIPRKAPASPA